MAEASPLPRTRGVRRAVAVLILAPAFVWAALSGLARTERARSLAARSLAQAWRGPVAVESVELGFPLTLRLGGVELRDPAGGEPWVVVAAAVATPSWGAPFSRASRVSLRGLQVRLRHGARGLEPLGLFGPGGDVPPGATAHRDPGPEGPRPSGAEPLDLPFERLEVREGTVRYEGLAGPVPLAVSVSDLSLDVSCAPGAAAPRPVAVVGRGSLGGGAVQADALLGGTPDAVEATVGVTLSAVRIDSMVGGAVSGRVDGAAALEVRAGLPSSGRGRLTVVDLAVASLGPGFGLRRVTLRVDAAAAEGDLHGALEAEGLAGGRVGSDVARDGGILRLDHVEVHAGQGRMEGAGFVSLGVGGLLEGLFAGPSYEVSLEGAGLPSGPDELLEVTGVPLREGRLEYLSVRLAPGGVRVVELRARADDGAVARLAGQVDVDLAFQLTGALTRRSEEAGAPPVAASVGGDLAHPKVRLVLDGSGG